MELIEAIKKAGVVGAGGAGFPTHVKLNAKAEYLIINAAECEPLIETDKFLCREFADRIIDTILLMGHHLEAQHIVIGLKAKYKAEIAALEKAIREKHAAVEIFPMRTFYPAGDEQVLVQQVTGRSVPERGLPLNVGAVVENVGTVLSIADALEDKPVTEKYLSVTGAVREPVMFKVPLGTPIRRIINQVDLRVKDYAVIIGGPMMGKMQSSDSMIDHAVVAALACFARGTTVIRDAQELKVKESNRIDVMVNNLRAMGAHIEGTDDGMIIEGGYPLHGAIIDSHLDHRIAMTFAITALASDGETSIKGADCVKISYPGFYEDLTRLAK